MFPFLKNIKKCVDSQVNLVILVSVVSVVCLFLAMFLFGGCASAPKTYSCPNEHSIPLGKINKSIRAINTCPICGAEFPYLAMEEKKSGGYSFGYQPCCGLGPRVWVYRHRTTGFYSYR